MKEKQGRLDEIQREILPILDNPQPGLTTYDAKDLNTHYTLI